MYTPNLGIAVIPNSGHTYATYHYWIWHTNAFKLSRQSHSCYVPMWFL